MTNNKQQTAVDLYRIKINSLTMDLFNRKISGEQFLTLEREACEQAKEMDKQETTKFTIGYFNWLHNNGYKYNPKVKMYWKMMINETLFFTIEELMIEFNKIQ